MTSPTVLTEERARQLLEQMMEQKMEIEGLRQTVWLLLQSHPDKTVEFLENRDMVPKYWRLKTEVMKKDGQNALTIKAIQLEELPEKTLKMLANKLRGTNLNPMEVIKKEKLDQYTPVILGLMLKDEIVFDGIKWVDTGLYIQSKVQSRN